VELLLDFAPGFWLGIFQARLGWAHGFDAEAGGGDRLYARVGASF
jgi:hypothetical protein